MNVVIWHTNYSATGLGGLFWEMGVSSLMISHPSKTIIKKTKNRNLFSSSAFQNKIQSICLMTCSIIDRHAIGGVQCQLSGKSSVIGCPCSKTSSGLKHPSKKNKKTSAHFTFSTLQSHQRSMSHGTKCSTLGVNACDTPAHWRWHFVPRCADTAGTEQLHADRAPLTQEHFL